MISFTTDDGETIRVAVRGHGPAIVLLHQWAADHLVWGDLPHDLAAEGADGHTVYCWDARGHGGHRRLGREMPTVDRMARDLDQLIEHFQLDRPLVIGHSMGALTLFERLRQRGTVNLGKLCIIDQSPCLVTGPEWSLGIYGDFSADRNRAFIASLQADFAETVLRLVADGHNVRARDQYQKNSRGIQHLREKLGQLDIDAAISIWISLTAADWRPVLPRIDIPTLLVYGSDSNYYGAATANWVHQAIPGSVLCLYDRADHSPHLAHRHRFLNDLRAFMTAGSAASP